MSDIKKGVVVNKKKTAALPKKGSKYLLNLGGVILFSLFTSHLLPPAHLRNGGGVLTASASIIWTTNTLVYFAFDPPQELDVRRLILPTTARVGWDTTQGVEGI